MTSLVNEFMQLVQSYSDLLEGTDWGSDTHKAFVPSSSKGLPYSDLLEDTEWA